VKAASRIRRGAAPQPVNATVVYARVSSDEQRERQTIETQRHFGQSWAELHQLVIERWFLDDGVSGTVPLTERPSGAELLEAARAGTFSQVLVYKLDRLGRDPRHILNAVADLEACGVRVKSMTEPFDTSEPAGRFMLTILSGVAGLERDTIIQRSVAGTERLAREGTWLGGIVPYGYRVVGKDRAARLVPADDFEALPGVSEANVVRTIFEMSARGQSCIQIGEYLNNLGVQTAYVRDARSVHEPGKRERATAGVWRPSRVRSILRSPTYRGVHQYGKRARVLTEVIERPVSALVTGEAWEAAQRTLERNLLFAKRNARRDYLLRGLIKCAHCGLTYIGTADKREATPRTIYKCNGRQPRRGTLGLAGDRCTGKSIYGDELEQQIWTTIEDFLRRPEALLDELALLLRTQANEADQYRADAARLEQAANRKDHERELLTEVYRRGTIKAKILNSQMAKIDEEEQALRIQVDDLLARAHSAEQATEHLRSTEALLAQLGERLDGAVSYSTKRELVERFVDRITVTTLAASDGRRTAQADVTYRFSAVATRTGTGCGQRRA
jgi:site-specific DNA recombinase